MSLRKRTEKKQVSRYLVHLLDLLNEILLIILQKLNDLDVLYSLLFDINNDRLDILLQEKLFSNIINFGSIDNHSHIGRFCVDILPRVRDNVKHLILRPILME